MSRFRASSNDLAYGDIPQRWDRERFERFGGRNSGPSFYEDDYRAVERDRPGRRDVAVAERREVSRPGSRFEERDRFFEEDRARSRAGPRRRTDRELFGDVDPREIAEMAMTPYKPPKSVTREEIDIDIRRGPRPGLLRRQSSLDTFDRRPAREQSRIPPYTPVPLPIRRRREQWDDRGYEDEDYREIEIQRERSVHRRRPPRSERSVKEETKITHYHKSDSSSSSSESFDEIEETKSVHTRAPTVRSAKTATVRAPSTRAPSTKARSRAPSVHENFHQTIIEEHVEEPAPLVPVPSLHESFQESAFEESIREERKFKKGKTRMPKRLVRVEAIMDLGYPFDEEEDFYVLRIALEKEQIDEVIKISEQYKVGEKRRVYKFEEKEEVAIPPPPMGEREEIQRTEWINPPTVVGARSHRSRSVRDNSPNVQSSISQRRSRSRRPSSPGTFVEERKTVIEEHRSPPPSAPPPPEFYGERKTIVEERSPSHHHSHAGTLVLADREHRSDRDINQEIRALETERRALRLEREAQERHDLALRVRENGRDDYQLVEYRDGRPREELVVYERERSPARNVIRVEKDRKAKRDARILAAAMATLT